jgi:RimJ/RimL family protein N-acetyltransferase
MSMIERRAYQLKTGEQLLVRSANSEDAGRIVELKAAIMAEDVYTLTSPGEFTYSAERERQTIGECAEQSGYLYLVAEVSGQMIGQLEFENGRWRKTAHAGMLSVYVDRDWRERGVGTILLRSLLNWAAAHPLIEKVTLAVFSSNSRAIAAYKNCGFEEEGRCARDMKLDSGEYIDSVLMYRFVKP